MGRGDAAEAGARRLTRLLDGSSGLGAADAGRAHGWVDGSGHVDQGRVDAVHDVDDGFGDDAHDFDVARSGRGRHVAAGHSPPRWRLSGMPAGLAVALLVVAVTTALLVLRPGATGAEELVLTGGPDVLRSPTASQPVTTVAPGATTEPVPAPEGPSGAPGEGQPQTVTGPVLVHVDGAVHRPGVVTLTPGARVADAVAAAGGATGDADTRLVNLARPVTDGELVVVPREGEAAPQPPPPDGPGGSLGPGAPAGGATQGSTGTGAPTLVDLNTADAAALDALPGIGPVLAERIVDHRRQNGGFSSVDELTAVSGIGPSVLADIHDLVTV